MTQKPPENTRVKCHGYMSEARAGLSILMDFGCEVAHCSVPDMCSTSTRERGYRSFLPLQLVLVLIWIAGDIQLASPLVGSILTQVP